MQIGTANGAGADADQELVWSCHWRRQIDFALWFAGLLEHHGAHRCILIDIGCESVLVGERVTAPVLDSENVIRLTPLSSRMLRRNAARGLHRSEFAGR